jgi:hypothetical protein
LLTTRTGPTFPFARSEASLALFTCGLHLQASLAFGL